LFYNIIVLRDKNGTAT